MRRGFRFCPVLSIPQHVRHMYMDMGHESCAWDGHSSISVLWGCGDISEQCHEPGQ